MDTTPQFLGRNVFDLDDYSAEEILYILEAAKGMKEINLREYKKIPTLRGKTICTLFVENSTRTRMSFELAASRLSADVVSFQASVSALHRPVLYQAQQPRKPSARTQILRKTCYQRR
jgi:aspartate carbamoyltransferase catalytic subunit